MGAMCATIHYLSMKRPIAIFLLLLFLAFVAGAALLLVADEGVQRRVAALPYYARAYLEQRRPTVVPPTPPPASDQRRQLLLAAGPPATPTPIATVTAADPTAAAEPLTQTTPTPTPSPTTTGTPTQTPTPPGTPLPESVSLTGVNHAWQLWNNCGPATIAMNLSYYGVDTNQRAAASTLKPNQDDKNVSPDELAAFARSQGFEAIVRIGGDVDLLQRLLANGFPVIVETWIEPEDRGGMGHYRLFTGYDAAVSAFYAQDSLHGPDTAVPIDDFENGWRVFNHTYVVIYRPQQANHVRALLGPAADGQTMLENVLATAREEATADPDDAHAWFNLGTAYFRLGDPQLAAAAFDEARRIGLPYRMLWYQFDIFEAYLAAGRYEDVAYLASATAYAAGGLEEAYYYQGLAYQALNQPDAAAEAFRDAIEYNPYFTPAAEARAEMEAAENR